MNIEKKETEWKKAGLSYTRSSHQYMTDAFERLGVPPRVVNRDPFSPDSPVDLIAPVLHALIDRIEELEKKIGQGK